MEPLPTSTGQLPVMSAAGEKNEMAITSETIPTRAVTLMADKPRSRVSRVLKSLKSKQSKWGRRRRRSHTASEALSSSVSISSEESESATSSLREGNSDWTNIESTEEKDGKKEDLQQQQQPQGHENKNSVDVEATCSGSNNTIASKTSAASTSDTESLQSTSVLTTTTPSSTVSSTCVVARNNETTAVVRGDLDQWFQAAHALLASKEMQTFVLSSQRVLASAVRTSAGTALTASGLVIKTAFLPVTVPLNVAASTTDLVINVAGGVVHHVLPRNRVHVSESAQQDEVYHTPAKDLLHHVFNFIPFVVENTVKMVSPALGVTQPKRMGESHKNVEFASRHSSCRLMPQQKVQSMAAAGRNRDRNLSDDDFLLRLRLDVYPSTRATPTTTSFKSIKMETIHDFDEDDGEDEDDSTTMTESTETSTVMPSSVNPLGVTKYDVSKFLLRVDDVYVSAPPNPASDKVRRATYVDLDTEFGDEIVTKNALSQLIQRGVDIASSNPAVDFCGLDKSFSTEIEWKPEGKTKKDIMSCAALSQQSFVHTLRSKVLIWSGKYRGPKYHGSDNPLFMARGIVNGCPRDFTMMLWDSSRTREYNKYCLGRKDVIIIEDEFSNGGTYGAKVIKSETNVPFTKLSVFLSAVMHVKALGDRPEDGYMIFSRSLDTGRAGLHVCNKNEVDQSIKNEIILGVNIMRPVPGHPELTDLISVSQVCANMVPPFLAFRIGMMGVEDFFKNVRS